MRKIILIILGSCLLTVNAYAIDVALAIELLVPAAQWQGSVTDNTEESFNNIRWEDSRKKPAWADLESAWADYEAQQVIREKLERQTQTDSELVEPQWQALIKVVAGKLGETKDALEAEIKAAVK